MRCSRSRPRAVIVHAQIALASDWLAREAFRIEKIVGSPELQAIKKALG